MEKCKGDVRCVRAFVESPFRGLQYYLPIAGRALPFRAFVLTADAEFLLASEREGVVPVPVAGRGHNTFDRYEYRYARFWCPLQMCKGQGEEIRAFRQGRESVLC